jgi:teichuronic acid biosynthesis glycosyltransferase TuaC
MSFMGSSQPPRKRPLRVLMVTGVYPTAHHPHAGTFIKSQVESLREAGLEVEVLHPKPGPALLRYASACVQVFFKTLSGRFDLVQGHYGQWCVIARMQWTTPVVANFLGSDLIGDVDWHGNPTWFGKLVVSASRWLCHVVDAALVQSEEMRQAAQGDAARPIFILPMGVDFALFRPIPRAEARAALGWDQERCYILFGNNPRLPVKNFPLAQAAVERLRARGFSAELVVANGLPQTQVVQYINASNALILSSYSEGSPSIVKETMACNVPVVSTNVGDVADLIGRTAGCAVCPPDPEALAAGLAQALQHKGPTTGRADIRHHERTIIAQQLIAIYEPIASKQAKRSKSSLVSRPDTANSKAP